MIGAALLLELRRAQHVGVGEPPGLVDQREARLKVADQDAAVDAVAVLEGVAVQEDVAQHDLAFRAREQIPGEAAVRSERFRSGQTGTDARRAEIGVESIPEPQGHAATAIGEDVPDGRTPESFYKDRQRAAVVREARILLAIYGAVAAASIVTGSVAPLTLWVVPALLGQPFLRLYLLAEHALCPLAPDMLENTRTTYTNRAVRFIAWNMPFHAEHHAWPSVPFHALPRVNELVRDRLKITAPGYVAVQREILRSLSPR